MINIVSNIGSFPPGVYIISETTAVTYLRMGVSEAVYIEPCCIQHPTIMLK